MSYEDNLANYSKDHCWQHDIRVRNKEQDLLDANLTEEQVSALRIEDFTFKFVEDKAERERLRDFIKRHEWLNPQAESLTHK